MTTDPVHSEAVRRKVEDLCHVIGALRQELNTEREKAEQEQRLTDGDLYVAEQEVRRLREAVERLHRPRASRSRNWCHECKHPYPCPTLRALDGAE